MISELQAMVGAGALKIIPKASTPLVVDVLENGQPTSTLVLPGPRSS